MLCWCRNLTKLTQTRDRSVSEDQELPVTPGSDRLPWSLPGRFWFCAFRFRCRDPGTGGDARSPCGVFSQRKNPQLAGQHACCRS
jgi:hypothetical protein